MTRHWQKKDLDNIAALAAEADRKAAAEAEIENNTPGKHYGTRGIPGGSITSQTGHQASKNSLGF